MKNSEYLAFLSCILFFLTSENTIFAQTTRRVPSQYPTIQAAIDAAANGDTVLVSDGVYSEEISFKKKLVKLISQNGAEKTIIEPSELSRFRGVLIDAGGNEVVIRGFTIRKFNQYGIYCEGSSPRIENNIIKNNTDAGIGIFSGGSPIITSNIITNDPINPQQHVGIAGAASLINRNLIINQTYSGIGTVGAQIVNNTISDNFYEGIVASGSTIKNNIIIRNNIGIKNADSQGSNLSISYNNVWNSKSSFDYFDCTPGVGNLSKDPLFVNSSNFTLQSSSPCIDAGDPTSPLDPDGTRTDMGAFYFSQGNKTLITGNVKGTWTKVNSPYFVVDHITVQSGDSLSIESGVQVRFQGHYMFVVNGLLKAIGTEADSILFTRDLPIEGNKWWGLRFINAADSCKLRYCIIEYGKASGRLGWPETKGGGIYCENSFPAIQNCTIRNNEAEDDGGGITVGNPARPDSMPLMLSSCVITNNKGRVGGGGGVNATGSSLIVLKNVLIAGCTALRGGGVYTTGPLRVINCTISNNVAEQQGGGIGSLGSTVSVSNSIVFFNQAPNGSQIFIDPFYVKTLSVSYSAVQNGWSGVGNINANPLFVDIVRGDYHLQANSPCINTGDPASPLDPDGTRADMGAFYFPQGANETFTDIPTVLPGLQLSSVAWGDYDNDGDLDILLTGTTGSSYVSKIYRNDSGNFVDIGAPLIGVWESSIAWGDYDNDGDLDILLTGNAGSSESPTPISLIYRNVQGQFVETQSTVSGVHRGSTVWGDYDNDGDLDILLAGKTLSGNASKIYRNDNGTFVDILTPIKAVGEYISLAWGDYDNDGDLDILLVGDGQVYKIYRNDNGNFFDLPNALNGVCTTTGTWGDYDNDGYLDLLFASKVYRNVGGNFIDVNASLTSACYGSLALGDYDNDGAFDILLTGLTNGERISKIYRNEAGIFSDITASLQGVHVSSVAWGDYDNDGDLDILLTGQPLSGGPIAKIYRNNISTVNTVPTPPPSLTSSVASNAVTLSWNKSTDNETAQTGLTYNLRVGTTPGGSEIVSPMANVNTGYRKVPQLGNTNHNTRWTIKNLPVGKYYWSVQAIDNAFAGSPFAPELSFTIGSPIDTTPPAPPQNLRATAGIQQITLNWNANTEADFLRYRIYGGSAPNPTTLIDSTQSVSATTKTIAGLTNGTTYYFRITAVDQSLNASGFSNEVSATPTKTLMFENVATTAGLGSGETSSVLFNDYNNDLKPDLYILRVEGSDLYKNDGNATFTLVPTMTPLDYCTLGLSIMGDYDNDGDLDIFISCRAERGQSRYFFQNDGAGNFTDVTSAAGIGLINLIPSSAAWFDFDRDGYLDLFLGCAAVSNIFMQNLGNKSFANYTFNRKLNNFPSSPTGIATGDFDRDGDMDVFLPMPNVTPYRNYLFRNDGNVFSEVAVAQKINFPFDRTQSAEFADYDNDGDLDLLIGNSGDAATFRLLRNEGFIFNDVTANTGLDPACKNFTGSSFSDFDNDGFLDLIISPNNTERKIALFHNNGNGTFSDITPESGIDVSSETSALAVSDFDDDGKLDIYFGSGVTNGKDQLYRNMTANRNWLKIRLIGTVSNKYGIGAWLKLTANSMSQYRQITAQTGYTSQNDLNPHFGLGTATTVDSLQIEWPSGIIQVLKNISANQFLTITESNVGNLRPAAPQNLAATVAVAQVTLTWNANTEADFLRYRIYGGTTANPTTPIDSVEGAANTSKTITNLTPETTYYFRITAVDRGLQTSNYSNVISATPLADKTAPVMGTVSHPQPANVNTAVTVSLSITDPSGLKNNVTLYYRLGGAGFYSLPMTASGGSTYTQTIPANMVTSRGVEFYVRAEDIYGNVAQTRLSPIRVYCANGIVNPVAQPAGKDASLYRLFSIPLDLTNKAPGMFISANPGFGAADKAHFRWYGIDRTTQILKEYPKFGYITLTPDMGFALLVNTKNLKLKTGSGTTVVTTTPYKFNLPAGWSLIGNPFNYNIPFDSLSVSAGAFELWSFDGDWQINTRGLEPWKGYAVWLSQAATISIRPGLAGLNTGTAFYAVENNDAENWLLQIIANNGHSENRFNFAGQHVLATDEDDSLDLHAPLRLADGVEVAFNNESLKADIRKPSVSGHKWDFVCRLNPEDEVLALTFDGMTTVPPTFDVFLLEPETATAYDLRTNPRLQFATRHFAEKRFQLIAGTKAYLQEQSLQAELHPSNFALLQNFPNPFNPATQIIYSLPEASHVEVSVYNLRGERVATLVNEQQASGSHTVVWNAEEVGTGVYFIKMRAGRVERMRKCVFVK